jgi:hypothetical protein
MSGNESSRFQERTFKLPAGFKRIKHNSLGISEVRNDNLFDTCFEHQVDKRLRSQAATVIFLFELETDRHEVIEPEASKSRFKKWHENIIGK